MMRPDDKQYIFGIRPVIEAIQAGKTIDRLMISKTLKGELIGELLEVAHEAGVSVQHVPVERINRVTRKNHQGVLAMLAAVDYYKLEQLVPMFYENGDNPFIVVLDGVTDVRNFGAIARTCECAGVSAIVIPERGSVSVNADAVKTSAGALNYIPVCRESNLVNAVRFLRDSGFKIVGPSDHNAADYTAADYTGPVAIIMGGEDTGISEPLMKLCDERVVIPEYGNIKSLNVSVAAGVMIYEVVRQRRNDNQDVI